MKRLTLLMPLILAGCATTSVTSDIATATQLNTAALTAATSLAQSGAISSAQLKAIYTVTNSVEAVLVTAEQAENAGNATTATATYTAALATISALTGCLKGTAATITACIIGVPQP